MLAELLLGNENTDIEPRISADNSSVVERVHSANSAAKDRRLNGFPESNSDGSGTNPRLALSHIMGPLNISDEMAQTTAHRKLLLLSINICHTVSVKVKEDIMKTYPSGKQYLAFPETRVCHKFANGGNSRPIVN